MEFGQQYPVISWDFERLPNDPVYQERKRKEEEKLYEKPYLPGLRVCLNPESREYNYIKENLTCDTGYVVGILLPNVDLKHWNQLTNKSRVRVKVKFDDNKIKDVQHRDLLPIDAPYVKITQYYLTNGKNIFIINDEESKELDEEIIINKCEFDRVIPINNEWRERVLKEIEENS